MLESRFLELPLAHVAAPRAPVRYTDHGDPLLCEKILHEFIALCPAHSFRVTNPDFGNSQPHSCVH